ncbi:MAG: TolC family protein [Bacteroidetes bacterium]|nr:TolC family protein [Bacteroidota bacterium]
MVCRIILILSFSFAFLCGTAQEKKLDYYVQQGLKNSPVVRDYHNQVRSASVDSLLIKALNKPQVGFRGYAYYAPVVNHYGYSDILTNIANLTTVMNVSQPIFNKRTVEANLLKAGIQSESLSNTLRLAEKELKKSITDSYLEVYSTFTEITLDRELISFAKEEGKILKSLTEEGLCRQTDYLLFMIVLQDQEMSLREQQILYRRKISELNLLCGIADTVTITPVKPDLGDIPLVKPGHSPFFERFRIDSLRIANEQILINRNYKPATNWFADAGLINNDPTVIYQNFGFSIGLNFTVPVYDGSQRKLNFRKLKSEEESRAGYASAFNLEYNQRIQQLLRELDETSALLPLDQSLTRNSKLLVSQQRELVRQGAGTIIDYLLVVKNYLSVRRTMNQHELRLLQIRNEISYWKNYE